MDVMNVGYGINEEAEGVNERVDRRNRIRSGGNGSRRDYPHKS